MCEEISDGLGRIIAGVRASLKRLEESQKQIADALAELKERSLLPVPARESYSSTEVAQLLGKRPFTVREWCRLGRVNAKKRACGSGAFLDWEISQGEVERIRNHGLLPIPKRR
jgi:hypothetical protein